VISETMSLHCRAGLTRRWGGSARLHNDTTSVWQIRSENLLLSTLLLPNQPETQRDCILLIFNALRRHGYGRGRMPLGGRLSAASAAVSQQKKLG
jgi:hypothetical protein